VLAFESVKAFLGFILVLGFVVGCAGATKSQRTVPGSGGLNQKPSESVDPEISNRLYFANLQVVIETTTEGVCLDSMRRDLNIEQNFRVELTENKELKRLEGPRSVDYYALNMIVQRLGFDSGRSQFSVLDGIVPEGAPYEIRVRRRPGNVIELYYLTEVFRMQFSQAPVYSFKTTEERGGNCIVTHTLNIFAENAGFYPTLDP
jgi:hypothetical protein